MEWKKLILLFIGIAATFGGFVGFILYLAPIFLYLITIGAMAFVIRHFHDGKRVDVSMKYVKAMGSLLTLQFLTLILLGIYFDLHDWALAMTTSLVILLDFIRQFHYSDLSPFTIFGSTYDTFTLSLIGILVFIFLVFLYIAIAATFGL